jgi:hypothetical protein
MKRTWTTNDGLTFGTYAEAQAHEKSLRQTRCNTKAKLVERLVKLQGLGDSERAHMEADAALLEFINSKEVHEAFDDIAKWYA